MRDRPRSKQASAARSQAQGHDSLPVSGVARSQQPLSFHDVRAILAGGDLGDALSDDEIQRVVTYLHSLCAEPNWPRGNLNFPRAFFTEKAFPENETVITTGVTASGAKSVENLVS